jgi:hypothetical protein
VNQPTCTVSGPVAARRLLARLTVKIDACAAEPTDTRPPTLPAGMGRGEAASSGGNARASDEDGGEC